MQTIPHTIQNNETRQGKLEEALKMLSNISAKKAFKEIAEMEELKDFSIISDCGVWNAPYAALVDFNLGITIKVEDTGREDEIKRHHGR